MQEKKIKSRRELIEEGYPRTLLDRAFNTRGQGFATKLNPLKPKSTIIFNMDGFDKWMKEQARISNGGGRV